MLPQRLVADFSGAPSRVFLRRSVAASPAPCRCSLCAQSLLPRFPIRPYSDPLTSLPSPRPLPRPITHAHRLVCKDPGAELADLQPYLLARSLQPPPPSLTCSHLSSSLTCSGDVLLVALLCSLGFRSSNAGSWSWNGQRNSHRILKSSSVDSIPLFELMHHIIKKKREEAVRLEVVCIMNLILLRSSDYKERGKFGQILDKFRSNSKDRDHPWSVDIILQRLAGCIGSRGSATEVFISSLCSSLLFGQDRLGVVALGSVRLYRQLTWNAALNFYVDLVNIVILRHHLQMASPQLILDSPTVAFKTLHSRDSYFIGILGFVGLWFHWFLQCISIILPPRGCYLDFFKSSRGILFLFVTHASLDYLFGAVVGNHFQVLISWVSIIVWTIHLGSSVAHPTSAWSSCYATASHMLGTFEEIHMVFQHLVVLFTSRLLDLLSQQAGFEEPLLRPLSLPLLWYLPYISCLVCSHSQDTLDWTWSDVIISISHFVVVVIVLFY